MNKAIVLPIFRITGVLIMLLAFVIVPDTYPWYVEILVFDIGLALWLLTKWDRFRNFVLTESSEIS